MQIKLYTGKSRVILMILILSPYLFLKNVIFRHGFMHKFAHEFVDEFFVNFVHEFKYEIRIHTNFVLKFLHEKLVMLRMACTVHKKQPCSNIKDQFRYCIIVLKVLLNQHFLFSL